MEILATSNLFASIKYKNYCFKVSMEKYNWRKFR